MAGSFHSRFGIDAQPEAARQAFRDALRLAAEKGGSVWIVENGDVVASLALTERLAQTAADHIGSHKAGGQEQNL